MIHDLELRDLHAEQYRLLQAEGELGRGGNETNLKSEEDL